MCSGKETGRKGCVRVHELGIGLLGRTLASEGMVHIVTRNCKT